MLQLCTYTICVPPFFWGGRGSREVQFCRLSYLAFPAPSPFFLSFFPLSLFLYRNIMHCCVIPPISPASHPSRTPHPLPFLSRTLLLPPPIIPGSPPLSSNTLFFSQFRLSNLLGELAFHLGEAVIIKFLHRTAVTAHLQQFPLFKHAFVFQIL